MTYLDARFNGELLLFIKIQYYLIAQANSSGRDGCSGPGYTFLRGVRDVARTFR